MRKTRHALKKTAAALGGLALVAAVSTIAWRVEVARRPSGGSDLADYFHWAVPFGVLMFLGWLMLVAPIASWGKRAFLAGVVGLATIIWYFVCQWALFRYFVAGPNAFLLVLAEGEAWYAVGARAIYVVLPLTPTYLALILALFGARPRLWVVVAGALLYLASSPLSVAVLQIVEPTEELDALGAIRRGVVIPFLVIGAGVIVMTTRNSVAPARADAQSLGA